MQKKIILQLEDVNRIRYESIDQFSESAFKDDYVRAFHMVREILQANSEYHDEDRNDTVRKPNDEQIYNVIAFLGNRGIGKTSAMLSFEAALKKERYTEEEKDILNDLTGVSAQTILGTSFASLECIDVTLLEKREGILDFILARMWDQVEELLRNPATSRRQELFIEDLRSQFMKVRNSHIEFQTGPAYLRNGLQDTASLRALHNLAASKNLREDFKELVVRYLDYLNIDGAARSKEKCLIISIDDIDVGKKDAYEILEEVRRFLTIPHVIVLLTADLSRLQRICAEHIAIGEEKNLEEVRNALANDYLAKALPRNGRIYLPDLREGNGINRPTYFIAPILESEKRIGWQHSRSWTEKDTILRYMANYFDLYFDGTRGGRHFLQHRTLRSLVNYFKSLKDVIENNPKVRGRSDRTLAINQERLRIKLAWFKEDIRYRLVEEMLDDYHKGVFQQLMDTDLHDINEQLIHFLYLELKKIDEQSAREYEADFSKGDIGYSKVLEGCYLIEKNGIQYRPFVDCVIAFYTLLMTDSMEQEEDFDQEYRLWPTPLSYGAWQAKYLFRERMNKQELVFIGLPLRLTISDDVRNCVRHIRYSKEDIESTVLQMMEENRARILAFEVFMLMFHNPQTNMLLNEAPITTKMAINTGEKGFSSISEVAERIAADEKETNLSLNILEVYLKPIRYGDADYRFELTNMIFNLYVADESDLREWPHRIMQIIIRELFGKDMTVLGESHLERLYEEQMEDYFLYGRVEKWKRKYGNNRRLPALPYENVELMYMLEKDLRKYYHEDAGQDIDYYSITKQYFVRIYNDLIKRDVYYRSLEINTRYAEIFKECPCIDVFLNSEESFLKDMYNEMFLRIEEATPHYSDAHEPIL